MKAPAPASPDPVPRAAAAARRHRCREEDVFVNLMRTADFLARRVAQVLAGAGISPTQYNVLRILRGAPDGLGCSEIARRMITRDPDMTRLLDRLERRGLIERRREAHDRRQVTSRIRPAGRGLLDKLDAPIAAAHRAQLGHLGRARLEALTRLLEAARAPGP